MSFRNTAYQTVVVVEVVVAGAQMLLSPGETEHFPLTATFDCFPLIATFDCFRSD